MSNVQTTRSADLCSDVRWNAGKDVAAAVLLLVALLLPWNLLFGVGVPDSSTWLWVPLVAVTVPAWAALAIGRTGGRGQRSIAPPDGGPARIRLALTTPYLLLVAGFVVFAYIQVAQFGGTGDVPAGIGPGLLVGLAGALLTAQPPLGSRPDRWFGAARMVGVIAAVLATVAVLANLYWRNRFPVQALLAGIYTGPNIAVIATTVVYAAVASVAVLVGLRWLITDQLSARLATVALGAATVLGTVMVWLLGVGREIDAFHGISQTTSTAAVGFEGYLAWVAVAAIVGPYALQVASAAQPPTLDDWREAVRKCLGLIAVWCVGSALLRVFDLIVAASLDMPYSPYDSVALLAFDVVAGAVAIWIRFNSKGAALHPAVLSAAAGVLLVLTVCRVVVGIGLAPRIMYAAAPEDLHNAVYGNMFAQQITSTFDVVLCWLAVGVAVIAVMVLQRDVLRRRQVREPVEPESVAEPSSELATRQLAPFGTVPTTSEPTPVAPKIARTPEPVTSKVGADAEKIPRITRLLEESTSRFAAGTTYTGTGPARPPSQP